MRRIVLILAVLSGLLCAGFVAATVYTNLGPADYIHICFEESRKFGFNFDPHGARVRLGIAVSGSGKAVYHSRLGIGMATSPGSLQPANRSTVYYVKLPYWLLITTTAVLPVAAIRPRRRWLLRSRRRRGLCLSCGYDLRESKERCPECGTPTSPKA